MPLDLSACVPVLLAAGREEALRPLLRRPIAWR
jgi:hypothetical protein